LALDRWRDQDESEATLGPEKLYFPRVGFHFSPAPFANAILPRRAEIHLATKAP
jgi:hypothetical protein